MTIHRDTSDDDIEALAKSVGVLRRVVLRYEPPINTCPQRGTR